MTDHTSIDVASDLDGGWAHRTDLVAYATRLLGSRSAQAEDVVQEAYLRLLRAAAADKAPPDARRWLFTVVRNVAVDERRRSIREASFVSEAMAQPARSTADIVDQREEAAFALQYVADLPTRERRAVELDQAGVAAPAIARSLGTTTNAVHQALFRARRSLRQARAAAWSAIPFPIVQLLLRTSGPTMEAAVAGGGGAGAGRFLPAVAAAGALIAGGVGTSVYVGSHHSPTSAAVVRSGAAASFDGLTRRATATARPVSSPRARTIGGLVAVGRPSRSQPKPAPVASPVRRTTILTPRQNPEPTKPAVAPEADHPTRTTAGSERTTSVETPKPPEHDNSGKSNPSPRSGGEGSTPGSDGSNRGDDASGSAASSEGGGGGSGSGGSGNSGSGSDGSGGSDHGGSGSDQGGKGTDGK